MEAVKPSNVQIIPTVESIKAMSREELFALKDSKDFKNLPREIRIAIRARSGGMNKKGFKSKRTIDKLKQQQDLEAFIQKNALRLAKKAMVPALGQVFIYRIEEVVTGTGPKGGEYKARKHVLVTDPREIEEALDEIGAEGGGTVGDNYYYITAKEPDHKAIQMLLDRGFGKPTETIKAEVEHKFSLRSLGSRREQLKKAEVIKEQ